MAEAKTIETDASVEEFLDSVPDEKKRQDSYAILELMKEVTGTEPKMWGPSIVGFGKYHYKYASGREGDAPLTGFSPRKKELSLYITSGFEGYDELMEKLGKYKTGKVCLYIKKLDDIDQDVLKELIERSVESIMQIYP